jgi:hypothetical protein
MDVSKILVNGISFSSMFFKECISGLPEDVYFVWESTRFFNDDIIALTWLQFIWWIGPRGNMMNLMVIGECCIEWVYSDLVCSKWEDRGTRTIRCKTIRCGQFVMDNSLHGQFVARRSVAGQFVARTIRYMDNSLQDNLLQDNSSYIH